MHQNGNNFATCAIRKVQLSNGFYGECPSLGSFRRPPIKACGLLLTQCHRSEIVFHRDVDSYSLIRSGSVFFGIQLHSHLAC